MFRPCLLAFVLLCGTSTAATPQLTDLRALCEDLTNRDVAQLEGTKLGARKPQLLSYVRRRCELQELRWDEMKSLDPAALAELRLLRRSIIERQQSETGIGVFGIIKMGAAHDFSPWFLRVKRETSRPPDEPAGSLFWSPPIGDPADAFDQQRSSLGVGAPSLWLRADKLEGKGSIAKLHARDLSGGARWLLKWGDEAHSDPVASRIFAGLGYHVDFPYQRGEDGPFLILGKQRKRKRTLRQLVNFIYNSYGVNLSPFIAGVRVIGDREIAGEPALAPYRGETYLVFRNFSLEPRPLTETRLGPFLVDEGIVREALPVRAALLAHLWIGNWDTKIENSLLSVIAHETTSQLRASFSDLGVSLGVEISKFPRDLKAGLVNAFSDTLIERHGDELRFLARMNHHPPHWRQPSWNQLRWMAQKIARFSKSSMERILAESGWPLEVRQQYLLRLGLRRRQILEAFDVQDPHPWQLTASPKVFAQEFDSTRYPQGLIHTKGRFRGYGW